MHFGALIGLKFASFKVLSHLLFVVVTIHITVTY